MSANSALFESALAQLQSGDVQSARATLRRLVALEPNHPDVAHYLGMVAYQLGDLPEAIEMLTRAALLAPQSSVVFSNLGVALKNAGRATDAADALKNALALDPANVAAHNNLGNALLTLGQPQEAIASFTRAIQLQPEFVDAHTNLGSALVQTGQIDQAIPHFRRAIELNPAAANAFSNLGLALRAQRDLAGALKMLQQAIAIDPNNPQLRVNLGIALMDDLRFDHAADVFRRAAQLDPQLPGALQNLANALLLLGFVDEAIENDRKSLRLRPNAIEHSNLLLALHYRMRDAKQVFDEHLDWARQHADPISHGAASFANAREPDRRLRVGYVSPDFRQHSVARFALSLIGAHDHRHFEIVCFDNSDRPDNVTDLFRSHADRWHRITDLSDDQAADLIRCEEIDILVDLAGHTNGNRLLVFARRPAPIQVTYLGYPNTTGLRAMNYRFTDAIADPLGMTEALHTESLVRLPDSAWCFAPSADSPDVTPLPMLRSGRPTFASFNNLAKISPQTISLWSQCLRAVPSSVIMLKAMSLGNDSARRSLIDRFASHGISADRLALLNPERQVAAHLSQYGQADLALDTFPYDGTTTTCEALWMGLPVVTLMGTSHVSRVSGSLLSAAGLRDFVAESESRFVEIVTGIVSRPDRLSELRTSMRSRLLRSPLLDAARFARNVEAAYRRMWRNWCTGTE